MFPEPFVPYTLVVHLGAPSEPARNISVKFQDYIKNVASSEIYPTWPEASLRANIYAIISFTMNRFFTQWYRSKGRGYNFDITNSTQYDQSFVEGRTIFENISNIVDQIFDTIVRRIGTIEPYFTAYCDGVRTQCEGLSQWGTVSLAEQGKTAFEILQYFFGNDIELVSVPVSPPMESYPGFDLRLGSSGQQVALSQVRLNRISRNFPAIPKIPEISGIFDLATENAVKEFQRVFLIPETGVIDRGTWYKISNIYVSVAHIAELGSEGIRTESLPAQFIENLRFGDKSDIVSILQYYLAVIGAYYADVIPPIIDGYFGESTVESVESYQRVFGFDVTGEVNSEVWNSIHNTYLGIVEAVPFDLEGYIPLYPGIILTEGMENEYVRLLQEYLNFIRQTYPNIPEVNVTGYFGPKTREAVMAFQRQFGINPRGIVASITWDAIATAYSDLFYGSDRRVQQFPGFTIEG